MKVRFTTWQTEFMFFLNMIEDLSCPYRLCGIIGHPLLKKNLTNVKNFIFLKMDSRQKSSEKMADLRHAGMTELLISLYA
jgi:hypothetical protein